MLDTEEAVFDQVIAVSLKGVFCGCKYGIPALLRAGGGSLITTASFVAGMGSATAQSAYTASKGGVLALTREIAVEFARRTHARIGSMSRRAPGRSVHDPAGDRRPDRAHRVVGEKAGLGETRGSRFRSVHGTYFP